MRNDLADVHASVWATIGHAGEYWNGAQRVELASTILEALFAEEPQVPWSVSSLEGIEDTEMSVAHRVVYRIARHAETLTQKWYERTVSELGGDLPELAYVELVALTSQVVAISSFRRAVGIPQWVLPEPSSATPTRHYAQSIERAELNWVPVASPADQNAAVVQAFSALPDEHERTWDLAAVQYIPDLEMVDPNWTRGTLSRPQMEFIAFRVAQLRQCFF